MFNPEMALSAPSQPDQTIVSEIMTPEIKETAVSKIIKRIKKKKSGEEKPPPIPKQEKITHIRDKLYTQVYTQGQAGPT